MASLVAFDEVALTDGCHVERQRAFSCHSDWLGMSFCHTQWHFVCVPTVAIVSPTLARASDTTLVWEHDNEVRRTRSRR
jgi:hypothetical protein